MLYPSLYPIDVQKSTKIKGFVLSKGETYCDKNMKNVWQMIGFAGTHPFFCVV